MTDHVERMYFSPLCAEVGVQHTLSSGEFNRHAYLRICQGSLSVAEIILSPDTGRELVGLMLAAIEAAEVDHD